MPLCFLHESFTTFISKQRVASVLPQCQEILDLFDPKMAGNTQKSLIRATVDINLAEIQHFLEGSSWNDPRFLFKTHIPLNHKDYIFKHCNESTNPLKRYGEILDL